MGNSSYVECLEEVAQAAKVLVSWATGSYAKDPEYWTGVRLDTYLALQEAVYKWSDEHRRRLFEVHGDDPT